MTRRFQKLLTAAAVLLCAGLLAPAAPAAAQGYDGILESQSGYDTPRRGGRDSGAGAGGGYDGLVTWSDRPGSATNPYGTAPAADIYGFVGGAGASAEDRRTQAQQQREEEKLRRRLQISDQNRANAEALQERLRAENAAREQANQQQRQEIMERMRQMQQQQQQQQGRSQYR